MRCSPPIAIRAGSSGGTTSLPRDILGNLPHRLAALPHEERLSPWRLLARDDESPFDWEKWEEALLPPLPELEGEQTAAVAAVKWHHAADRTVSALHDLSNDLSN